MTTRNKRKLAALNKENCEEHPRSNLAQNSSAPRSQEEYITQVSEEIEGRVTKRLSKEFSRTENRILGALARLDDFLMNPLLPGYSGATPEPTRSVLRNNQGTNEDDSQNDPHPEAGLFHSQSARNAGPEDDRDSTFSENWLKRFIFYLSFPRKKLVTQSDSKDSVMQFRKFSEAVADSSCPFRSEKLESISDLNYIMKSRSANSARIANSNFNPMRFI